MGKISRFLVIIVTQWHDRIGSEIDGDGEEPRVGGLFVREGSVLIRREYKVHIQRVSSKLGESVSRLLLSLPQCTAVVPGE